MYQREILIPYYMVKESEEMALSYLIREMVQTSILDFNNSGIDLGGKIWVLINWDIQIDQMPVYDKKYTFTTDPIGHRKFYAMRDFTVCDSGKEIIKVKSLWMLIDLEKRTIASLPESYHHIIPKKDRKTLKDYQIDLAELEDYERMDLEIANGDIDMNGHVSNAIYLDWFENSLDFEEYQDLKYDRVKVFYRKEILANEPIEARVKKEDMTYHYQIYNKQTNQIKASLEIKLK